MVKLSFCIPTYNRAKTLISLVERILSKDDEEIEIIISDNASSDNTLQLLKDINDNRLFVYTNEINQGTLLNTYKAFSKATGEYIIFLTDKDNIDSEYINDFKLFIYNNNLSCGYCEYIPQLNTENKIFERGFESLSNVAYLCIHPSGYFFNRKYLNEINYLQKYSNKDVVGEFAFEFIFAELVMKDKSGIFNKQLILPQKTTDAAKDKSLSIKGTTVNAYYMPTARLNIALNFSKHVNSLALNNIEKKKMIFKIFTTGLYNATFVYKTILSNKQICEHYYLEPRTINKFELLEIAFKYNKEFFQNNEIFKYKYLNMIFYDFLLFKNILEKLVKKLIRKIN